MLIPSMCSKVYYLCKDIQNKTLFLLIFFEYLIIYYTSCMRMSCVRKKPGDILDWDGFTFKQFFLFFLVFRYKIIETFYCSHNEFYFCRINVANLCN